MWWGAGIAVVVAAIVARATRPVDGRGLLEQLRRFKNVPRLAEPESAVVVTMRRHIFSATGTVEYCGDWNLPTMLAIMPVQATVHCKCVFGVWYPLGWRHGWLTKSLTF
jgi:hypothetical protein